MSPGVYGDVDLENLGERTSTGDGKTPQGPSDGASSLVQGPVGPGPLLEEEDDKKVFSVIDSIVRSQEKLAKNRDAKATHWARIRRGVPFSSLEKDEDKAIWRATLPPGVSDTQQPVPNKADDLCSKIVSQVLTDPFLPNPKPQDENDEKHRAAADLAKRFLTNDGDESGTNDAELFRDCLDTAMTRAAFVHVWVDETAGGWRPKQIMAAPDAMDPMNPLLGATGQPATDYVLRYVTPDGQFTENPAEADRQWLPKHQRDVLTDAHVRTVPETSDIGTAEAVILLMAEPLRKARRRFPMLRDMEPDMLRHVVDWRPLRPKAIVPQSLKAKLKGQDDAKDADKPVSDSALVFYYLKYCRVGDEYPDGAEIAVNGANDGLVLKKATLRDDVPVDVPGKQQMLVPVLRDIPVAMFKALHDSEERDPFGRVPLEKFGGANEALAQLYGSVLEDNDRRLHPNVFLTATSSAQEPDLFSRTGRPILVLTKDDMPMYEEFGDLASFTPTIIEKLENSMDQAANMGDTAQGLENPNAVSGKAKEIVVGQNRVNLAATYQNTVSAVKRYWRIKLELAQAKLTVPQRVEYTGTDSAYKAKWWTGADFHGVKDVSILPGSGTMMAPVEKQQSLGFAQQAGWLDPEEAASAGRSTVSGDLGLKPNPHEERINRELAAWSDGPPEGWVPPMPTMQEMQDPATGAMVPQQVMSAPSSSPFSVRPCDQDPTVAKTRYRVMRDFMATSDYSKQPPEWRALLDQASEQARQAAGVATVAEQQAAAQQQAMAQQEQANADADRQGQEKDKDRAMQQDEAAKDRDASMQQSAMAAQAKQQPPQAA